MNIRSLFSTRDMVVGALVRETPRLPRPRPNVIASKWTVYFPKLRAAARKGCRSAYALLRGAIG